MEPILTKLQVADTEMAVKDTRMVENGTVYRTTINGHDFCIFESFTEKAEKEQREVITKK